ncbi:MAG TPA: rhomboid family intramembrane serine protease [Thermoleophilaceae bacterium]|nr:rhomboid family intramembrane serine protease [Thermoleophilaceae bacterium]
MIPLKDDIPARRPPVVTFVAIAAAALAWLVAGDRLGVDGGGWTLLVAAAFLWLFAPSVEDAMGQARFTVFLVAGGALTWALDPAAAVAGSVAAVLGAYAVLYPRAHVVALNLVPGFMTVTQVPAPAVLVLWLPLQALAGGLDPAPLAGLAAGAAAARPLAHRVQHDYERAPAF